jgi:hypothetical protein
VRAALKLLGSLAVAAGLLLGMWWLQGHFSREEIRVQVAEDLRVKHLRTAVEAAERASRWADEAAAAADEARRNSEAAVSKFEEAVRLLETPGGEEASAAATAEGRRLSAVAAEWSAKSKTKLEESRRATEEAARARDEAERAGRDP